MLERGYMTANYSPEACGLYTDEKGGLREHRFVFFKLGGDQKSGQLKRNADVLEFQLSRLVDDRAKARSYHKRLCRLVSLDDFGEDQVSGIAREDICDRAFAEQLARLALIK